MLPASDRLHQIKYRQPHESFRDSCGRIASALADTDVHFYEFRDALLNMRFLPGGRIQRAVGAGRYVTAFNCYVSGTIPDSFVHTDNDEESSIMARASEAAMTMRMGGGIGYDFSTLRPRGDLIRKLMSHSSGPISFMHIFDAVCRATASSGHRRGAQMGVLRIDHPDIFEFINAKHDNSTLTGFNISVAVTDEFMECLGAGKPFRLKFGGEEYQEVDPQHLWETLMRSTWDWAEPGVLFIDTINNMNNLWYCEQIAATNPCGEQPLPPFGACLLGSFNLAQYMTRQDYGWDLDIDLLRYDIPHVVRAMDNVVDASAYPLPAQMNESHSKRRMGLGVTGLANAIEAMGHPYGSPEFLAKEAQIEEIITRECYRASVALAIEKGPFPLFDPDLYSKGRFVRSLDSETQELIYRNGIRNSHLTSQAPTGTISTCADNVSSGIEPVFSYEYERDIHMPTGVERHTMRDYGYATFGVRGKKTSQVTIDEHLSVLAVCQKHVDSAASKTCNVSEEMSWDEFCGVYSKAWELGCKGVTTFNSGGKRMALLTAKSEEKVEEQEVVTACTIDPISGERSCAD